MSPPDVPEATLVQVDAPIFDVVVSEEFGGGPYDLSLLISYIGHAARQV